MAGGGSRDGFSWLYRQCVEELKSGQQWYRWWYRQWLSLTRPSLPPLVWTLMMFAVAQRAAAAAKAAAAEKAANEAAAAKKAAAEAAAKKATLILFLVCSHPPCTLTDLSRSLSELLPAFASSYLFLK